MKKFIKSIGKTGTALIGVLTFITLVFGCWEIYKTFNKKNIAGAWKLKFTNETSSYKPYIGETNVQEVFFSHNDNEVNGNGEKIEYNGKPLPANMHRLLEYNGTVEDDCLKARFIMSGLLRKSGGNITVQLSEDGTRMEGRFVCTAGNTTGTVTGEKLD